MTYSRINIINALLWATLGAAVLGLSAVPSQPAHAQTVDESKAARVKAAYMVNFMRFTQWPEEAFEHAEAPIVLTVLGDDPMGRALDLTVREVTIEERQVVVRRLRWPLPAHYSTRSAYEEARARTTSQLRSSHLLLLAPAMTDHAADALAAIEGAPVLTVGDGYDFMPHGVMLGLELDKDRIVFYANVTSIRRSPLAVSSRLLSLARLYEP